MPPTRPSTTAVVPLPCGWISRLRPRRCDGSDTEPIRTRPRRGRSSSSLVARSGLDADDLVPVDRVLIDVRDPHQERVVEEAPNELHADGKASRRLAHWES